MTDKELARMLTNAYRLPASERGGAFIKAHEKRSRRLWDVIKNEFRYMGAGSVLAGVFLCAVFFAVAKTGNENMTWLVSSIIPVCSLLPMTLLLRSERYGMCELEAASRFSLRFIRLVRMLILGLFSSVVLLCAGIFFRILWECDLLDMVLYMLFPYFVSIWGCLIVARTWHGKESVVGVPMVCIATGFLPAIIRELRTLGFASDYVYVVMTVGVLVAMVKECRDYINERSDFAWNLY